ncbi:MAG: PD40 domain-containing protein [Rhodothermia bacterium]|nr:PD40 domain-containing protein [Rhodothermia bacterium]
MSKKRLWGMVFLILALPCVSLSQVGYSFGRNKIRYTDFDWKILKTAHFDFYHYPEMEDLAKVGAAIAEESYRELQNKFNFSLSTRVPMIFYATNLHFKQTNTIDGFIPDGVGGFFEFMKGRVVIPANGDLNRFKRVIRHEMVHVFTFNKLARVMRDYRKPPDRLPPLWFTEGLAEYWSGEADHQHEMMIRDAIASNSLVPLEDIDRIYGTYLMYKQGESVCRFIAEKWGDEYLLRLIEDFWKETYFEKLIERTLNVSYREFGTAWEAWLKAQYYPTLQNNLPASRVSAPVFWRGYYMKPVAFNDKKGQRWVVANGSSGSTGSLFKTKVNQNYVVEKKPKVILRGERNERFEAFHFFESRMSVNANQELAFVTKSGEQDVIHVLDLTRNVVTKTIKIPELVAIYSPSWHPNGKQVVFTGIEKSGFSDIYTYHLETQETHKLTHDLHDDRDPDWSPDGQQIVFSSDRTGSGNGAYNLFLIDPAHRTVKHLTEGPQLDLSPRFSPDGKSVVFIRTKKEDRKWTAQNAWTVSLGTSPILRQLTNTTSVLFDPYWTADGHLLATAMDGFRFQVRSFGKVDSLQQIHPEPTPEPASKLLPAPSWTEAATDSSSTSTNPYRRKYTLDAAQTVINQTALYGTNAGGYMVFSDMMGNDYFLATLYNTSRNQRDFLRSMSFSLSRYQFQKRTSTAYGLYRNGGLRYDLTDPDAAAVYPAVWEHELGGYGALSYPISFFDRFEVSTGLNWSDKQILTKDLRRKALLLSNTISYVHDSALYGMNGPMDGFRANLTAGYTTDVWRSNVSYYTLIADVRKYFRILPTVTFAVRAMGRMNEGREARLFYMGGSWDLRGYPLFDIRGSKTWFGSAELRFPLVENPLLIAPVLAPFGVVNLRSALFFDAGHAWNKEYNYQEPQLMTGKTHFSSGIGFRLNLFGGLLLRYDLGWRINEDFSEKKWFRQFLFGWDF